MKKCICLSFLIVLFAGFVVSSTYAEILVWDPSTGTVDGYRIHYGTSQNNFDNSVDVGDANEYSLDLLPLAENVTYYFVVTAINQAGESDHSNMVSFTPGDTTPPAPPSDLVAN